MPDAATGRLQHTWVRSQHVDEADVTATRWHNNRQMIDNMGNGDAPARPPTVLYVDCTVVDCRLHSYYLLGKTRHAFDQKFTSRMNESNHSTHDD
jgi:hypothetical protein